MSIFEAIIGGAVVGWFIGLGCGIFARRQVHARAHRDDAVPLWPPNEATITALVERLADQRRTLRNTREAQERINRMMTEGKSIKGGQNEVCTQERPAKTPCGQVRRPVDVDRVRALGLLETERAVLAASGWRH